MVFNNQKVFLLYIVCQALHCPQFKKKWGKLNRDYQYAMNTQFFIAKKTFTVDISKANNWYVGKKNLS